MSHDKFTAMITQRFGANFWNDHAGRLIKEPQTAIIELIANSWDAGATKVEILWPPSPPEAGYIQISDNGVGMTFEEFETRWSTLNYNRLSGGQGRFADLPVSLHGKERIAYGRNGKGRHSMFCFSFEYWITTWKNGVGHRFHVKKIGERGIHPFEIRVEEEFEQEGHGTIIKAQLIDFEKYISLEKLRELIGTTFVLDPEFTIYINDQQIELADLESAIIHRSELSIPPYGSVEILTFDSKMTKRTSLQHGVAWWVNKRVVGTPSWEGIEIGKYIDRRKSEAKQYSFVVLADILADNVLYDWTGFEDNNKSRSVIAAVNEEIQNRIASLFEDVRRNQKQKIFQEHKEKISNLSISGKRHVNQFVDALQKEVPSIQEKHLSAAVGVLSNLELAKSGYKLLNQLAELDPDDIDNLSYLLDQWTVLEAKVVLDELHDRLLLIKKLESVVETNSDELHEIHPLIEKGLWVFGPEYESVEYVSNRWLSTVLKNLFKDNETIPQKKSLRPDIVALPTSDIRIFSRDAFDESSVDKEVSGIDRVLIIELKKGNSEIGFDEMNQADRYAMALNKSGKLLPDSHITVYVLGTFVSEEAIQPRIQGTKKIIGMPYSTLLHKAHTRTHRLIGKTKTITGNDLLFENELNNESLEVNERIV